MDDARRFNSDPDREAILLRHRILRALATTGIAGMVSCGGKIAQEGNAAAGGSPATDSTYGDTNIAASGGNMADVSIVTGGASAHVSNTGGSETGGQLAYATGGAALNTGGWLNVGGADAGLIQTLAMNTGGLRSCGGCQGGMCQGCT